MRAALFLLFYLAMIPAALSAAHVGMMFYIWSSLAAADSFTFGALQQIPLSKIAIAIAVLSILRKPVEQKPYFDVTYAFLLAFFCQCAISFLFALTDGPQFYHVADRVWKIALLCLLMNPVLRGRLQIHSVVIVLALSMGVQGGMEGLKYLITGGGYKMFPPPHLGDNNTFGLFVLMSVPILMYLFRYTIDPFVRLAIIGGVLVNIVAIIGTGSRGAFVGIVAISLAMVVQSKRRISTLLIIVAVGAAIAWFAPSKVYERLDTIQAASEDLSFLGRVRAWKLNTLVAIDRPFAGGGFSSMEDPVVWLAYLPKFSRMDFLKTDVPDKPRAAHSIYFQVLGDTGFSGLFLYLGILVSSFLSLRRIRKQTAGIASMEWAYDLAGHLRLTMIAMVVSGAALSAVYFDLPFLVFCLISILGRTVRDELGATNPSTSLSVARFRRTHSPAGLQRPV